MGGNALKLIKTRRYSLSEYKKIEEEISSFLVSCNVQFFITKYLDDKESFGDIDIIYHSFDHSVITDFLRSQEIRVNGPIVSCNYRDFQVDLIKVAPVEYQFACRYHMVSDLGNFAGKLAHVLGLKYGHDGLSLPVRSSDDHLLGEVYLTRDPKIAAAFLDVEYKTEFNNFQEIFENVVASKYFNPDSYKLENNNAIARVRDKKRPAYSKFLELCSSLPPREYFPRVKDKSVHLPIIFEAFPDAKVEYDRLYEEKFLADAFAEKLNGNLVREWTGLDGKDLGEFMKLLKQSLNKYNTVTMNGEKIKDKVMSQFTFIKELI